MKALLAVLAVSAFASAQADPLRDPTRPPQAPGARATVHEAPPVLSAVFTAGERRSVIFNGHLVRAGDAVGAYAIEDVLDDGVRYRHAGAVHELYLPHPANTIKKPTTAPARGSGGP
jgi:hypothetical protein